MAQKWNFNLTESIDDKTLIEETYSASLQPDKLMAFEQFWESYIDAKIAGTNADFDQAFLERHFSMALGIVERLRHYTEDENYFDKIVMAQPGLAFIINEIGKVVSSNPDATAYISNGQNITSILSEGERSHILKWIGARSEREMSGKNPYLFQSVEWGNAETAVLFIMPIKSVEVGSSSDMAKVTHFIVTQVDLDVEENMLPAFQDHFSLSQTEARIAMHLANGTSVKQVSELRGTSEHTVRTQIKQILSKTSSRDLSNLVRNILSYSATFKTATSQIRRVNETILRQKHIRTYSLILPDGRYMEYIEQGHPNGRPVLLFHCIVRGVRLTEAACREAVLRNWRIIIPIRAGFGNSDPNFKNTPLETVHTATEDVKFLLDHLKIRKLRIMTDWAGAFACHFCLVYPEKVSGILQIACVPLWKNNYLKYFKMRHRVILKTSIYAPAAAPYMLRVGKALIDGGRHHLFVREMDQESEQDLTALERDKETMTVMSEGFELYLRQGIHAFLNDIKVIHSDWSHELSQLSVPITVLRGSLQHQPIEIFNTFKKVVPHALIKHVPNGNIYMRFNFYKRLYDELEQL